MMVQTLKKNRYIASDIGIYLPLDPPKICANVKGVYRHNTAHAVRTTSLYALLRADNADKQLHQYVKIF